ncbi:MAG: hypothetical protein R3D00_10555 [Bacteroidia bacterium]
MSNSLFLIFTIFDDLIKDYSSLLNLTDEPGPKAILFDKVFQGPEFRHVVSCDIILLPDNTSEYPDISHLALSPHKIYGVLHKSSKDLILRKHFIQTVAGEKLQHPLLIEHHSSGRVFEFLVELGKAWQRRSLEGYNDAIRKFTTLFSFDLVKEARLEFLHLTHTIEGIERILGRNFPRSATRDVLFDLSQNPILRRLLYDLKAFFHEAEKAAKIRQQMNDLMR